MKITKSKLKDLMMRKKKVKAKRLDDMEKESQSRKAQRCRSREAQRCRSREAQ